MRAVQARAVRRGEQVRQPAARRPGQGEIEPQPGTRGHARRQQPETGQRKVEAPLDHGGQQRQASAGSRPRVARVRRRGAGRSRRSTERGVHRPGVGRLRRPGAARVRRQVVPLSRVAGQVVELEARQPAEILPPEVGLQLVGGSEGLLAVEDHQLQPSEHRGGAQRTARETFGERRPLGERRRTGQGRQQVEALPSGVGRGAGGRREGGRHVQQPDRAGEAPAGRDVAVPAPDQRHVDLLFVERLAVLPAAVVEQLFAVVGGEHHQGVGQHLRPQAGEHLADGPIDVVHLAVVQRREVGDVAGRIGQDQLAGVDAVHPVAGHRTPVLAFEGGTIADDLGIVVRVVRIDVVQVEEERAVPVLVGGDPGERVAVQVVGMAPQPLDVCRRRVEGAEAALKAGADVHRRVGQEAGGLVTGAAQALGGRQDARRDAVRGHVGAEQLAGVAAGHHRDHRRQRPGRLAIGLVHDRAGAGQPARDLGRGLAAVAVRGQPVAAQGVDEDDDDVGADGAGPPGRGHRWCRRRGERRRPRGRRGRSAGARLPLASLPPPSGAGAAAGAGQRHRPPGHEVGAAQAAGKTVDRELERHLPARVSRQVGRKVEPFRVGPLARPHHLKHFAGAAVGQHRHRLRLQAAARPHPGAGHQLQPGVQRGPRRHPPRPGPGRRGRQHHGTALVVDLEVGERRPDRKAQAGQTGVGTEAGADGVASRLDQRPEHESLGSAVTGSGQQGGGEQEAPGAESPTAATPGAAAAASGP